MVFLIACKHSCSSHVCKKGKGSSITCKGHRGVTGFYAHHFSISQLHDSDACLYVTVLPSPSPKWGSY